MYRSLPTSCSSGSTMAASFRFLVIALVAVIVLEQVFSTEAKVSERDKQKYHKQGKYNKAEGQSKEAKYRYSKHSQDKQHKTKKSKDYPVPSEESEDDQEGIVEQKLPVNKVRRSVKTKKTSQEQSEEPTVEIKQKSKKDKKQKYSIPSTEEIEDIYRAKKSAEQKIKRSKNKRSCQSDEPEVVEEKVKTPKRITVKRESIIFEEEDLSEDEEITNGNAVQTYIIEESEDPNENEGNGEGNAEKCYYEDEENA